jgi:hypothetical protein
MRIWPSATPPSPKRPPPPSPPTQVKALASFASVRAKLLDRAYERWFLPLAACKDYSCTNSSDPLVNANLYYSDLQTYNVSRGDCGVGLRCTQYFFDVRNESLRTWLASSEYLFGPTALGSPAIHGFYFVRQAPWRALAAHDGRQYNPTTPHTYSPPPPLA